MHLPFQVEFERPTRAELRHTVGRRRTQVILGVGVLTTALGGASLNHAGRATVSTEAAVSIRSTPPGAAITIDGHQRGVTPAMLAVNPGRHLLVVHRRGDGDVHVSFDAQLRATATVSAHLWRAVPVVREVQAPLPGTAVDQVGFLDDGRVWLSLVAAGGAEHQLWVLTPGSIPARLGSAAISGPLVPSPDGERLAYAVSPATAPASATLLAVTVTPATGGAPPSRYALPLAARAATIIDLSWAPDGRHLLILAERGGSAPVSTFLWLDVASDVHQLGDVPSGIVPGSYSWSLDSTCLAFLARSGSATTLCLLDASAPSIRALADLNGGRSVPPTAPLSWSPDGRAGVYAAAVAATSTSLGGVLWGQSTLSGLFLLDAHHPDGARLTTLAGSSPAWRPDGSIVAVAAMTSGAGPALHASDVSGNLSWPVATLPVPGSGALALRWDAGHAQALAERRAWNAAPTYWLLSFDPEVQP